MPPKSRNIKDRASLKMEMKEDKKLNSDFEKKFIIASLCASADDSQSIFLTDRKLLNVHT